MPDAGGKEGVFVSGGEVLEDGTGECVADCRRGTFGFYLKGWQEI